jgi:Uri superfamily endonuclease
MEAIERHTAPKTGQISIFPLSSSDGGSYVLILYLSEEKLISVGKPGEFEFPSGYYAYIGSALGMGGLRARLRHHLHITNNPNWHIDYLRKHVTIKEIWICKSKIRYEHAWASMIQNFEGATVPVPHFGSSDCRCLSHLFVFNSRPLLNEFQNLVHRQCSGDLKTTLFPNFLPKKP